MLQSHYSLKDGSWCSQATLCDCVTVWLRDAVTVWLWAVAWTMEQNKKYLSVIRFITQTCLLCVTCSSMKQILIAPVQVRLMTWRILTLFITSMFVCNSGDPGAPLVSTQPGNTEPLHNADTHWWRCVFECDYIWLFFPYFNPTRLWMRDVPLTRSLAVSVCLSLRMTRPSLTPSLLNSSLQPPTSPSVAT